MEKLWELIKKTETREILVGLIVNNLRINHKWSINEFDNNVVELFNRNRPIREYLSLQGINSTALDPAMIRRFANDVEDIRDKYQLRQHSWLYNTALDYAITTMPSLTKRKMSFNEFCKNPTIKDLYSNDYMTELSEQEKAEIYDRYRTNYDVEHGGKPQLKDTYRDKLKKYIIEHEELLNPVEFNKVVHSWSQLPKNKTAEQLYTEYYQLYYDKPEASTVISLTPVPKTIGYKSKQKRQWLRSTNDDTTDEPTNYFPLKSNIKRYQTHKVSSRGSYIIDLMFVKNICYLVAININTRYLVVEPMNVEMINNNDDVSIRVTKAKKNITKFLRALQKVRATVTIKHLYGDGERAFIGKQVKDYYDVNNIVWHDVPRMIVTDYDSITKTEPQHTSLGIIDRVIRTIRDIGWNMKVKTITPTIMKSIVDQYNNAPHNTLSHYAGFPVSPTMVQNDASLEEYIIREIMKENYNITRTSLLSIGDKVKVYNLPDPMIKRRTMIVPGEHRITGFKNGYYNVRDSNGHTQKVPRYRLSLMNHS